MAALAANVTNSVWHAFSALDENKSGQVSKSKLKVLTANLGTLLQCLNAEKGLQDHRSTPYLKFEDYMFYLQKELFSSSPCTLEWQDFGRYQEQVEEVCWLVCRKQFLGRDSPVFPDSCVYQLFRIFCTLAELVPCQQQVVEVVLSSQEVDYIAQAFVLALGQQWDKADFQQVAKMIPAFRFPIFLALLESQHAKNVEQAGLVEAVQELYDIFVKDVIKKGFLYKRGQFLPSWKEGWFVLQPNSFTYYTSRSEKEQRGEIVLNYKCIINNVPEMANMKSNRFLIRSQEKTFEFAATDQKTKLQWILALQTAIEHSGTREKYQKRLSCRRKAEREVSEERKREAAQISSYHKQLLEKQQAELEAEKLARQAAEQQAREQAALREKELQRVKELEDGKKELERLLEDERQAKTDEEIVRNLQARVLREEWEKREELERLQSEQIHLLEEERNRREGLEAQTVDNQSQLGEATMKLKRLEEEREQLDKQLKETKDQLLNAELDNKLLKGKLQEAQAKIVSSERAKEVLEAKLKARERSFIPVMTKTVSKIPTADKHMKRNHSSSIRDEKTYFPSDGDDI